MPEPPPAARSESAATYDPDIVLTAKGGGIVAIGRVISYGSRFLITFVMARLLSAEQYGLYNLAISGAAIAAAVARFGLDTAMVRYVAIMNGRRDARGLWGALQVGLGGTLLLGSLSGAALFALAYPIADRFFGEPRLAPLLQLASIFIPSLALGDVLAGATRGFKSMREMVIAQNIVQPLLKMVIVGLVALSGLDVVKAVIAFGLSDLGASILLVYFLNQRFKLHRSLRNAERPTGEILGFSLPLWIADMMSSFRGNIQTILIGSLNSVRGVGIFTIADQLNLLGSIVHRSITTSARPVVSELHDKGDWKQLGQLYQTTNKWVLTLNLPAIFVMVLFPRQLMSIFGREFAEGATTLTILAFVNLVYIGTGMCGAIIEMTGQSKWKLFNSVVRLALSIALNVLLIPRWGIVGAAVAALLLETISNSLPLIQVWWLYRLLPYNRTFIGPVAASLIAVASVQLVRTVLPAENVLNTAILILLSLAVYGGVILKLGLSAEDLALIARVRRRAAMRFSRA